MTIARYLTRSASAYGDRCALVFGDRRWSYAEYEKNVNRFANAFAGAGVREGDRIAVFQTNCPEHIFTLFASAKLGAAYCPLNYRLKGKELAHVLDDSEPKIVLVGHRYAEQINQITASIKETKHTLIIDASPGEPGALQDFINDTDYRAPRGEIHDDATAILLYTSGTVDMPKGVMHSHANLIARCEGRKTPLDDPSIEKVGLIVTPVFHITGIQQMFKNAASASTLIIMPQFKVEDFLRIVETKNVMSVGLVPTMIHQIMEHPDQSGFNLDSLRVISYGGSSISPALIRKLMKRLPGCKFAQGYGLTEVGVTWLQPHEHTMDASPGQRDPMESVGRAIPGIEIAIVDDSGKRLAQGEIGEIIVVGSNIMQGYWCLEEENARAFRDGWFYTGDMGYLDPEGFLFISGRKKDLIIRGGENILPIEVENVLISHPDVADAAVFGIPNPRWGEIVAAAVVPEHSREVKADELIEFCRQQIASFKKPERIFITDTIPRNAAGKAVRKDLREAYTNSD
ncbi:class I adenylate-forming enzyme family protein [Thermodesulfobacteriota bacterium]